jgi:serine/threonine protein kinase
MDGDTEDAAQQPSYAGPNEDPDRFEFMGNGLVGGEGITWQGRYTGALSRPVTRAVKMLNQPESANGIWPSEDDRRRWLDMRHLVQTLENPHLVHLHDVFFGPPPHAENTLGREGDGREYTTPYFVMEWIAGPSLDEHIRSGTPDLPERLGYIRDLAEAIDSLHSITRTSGNPMLHRDIKPGNCLLDPRRGLVLVDLGTLRRVDDGYDPLGTHTLHYTAPEVLRDPRNPRSPASDCYALGAVAYFCLVEDDPPAASDLLARRTMRTELTAAGQRLGAPAPEALADHILEMLHPSPRRRPHTCVRWADQALILATSGAADWLVRRRRRRSIRAAAGGLVVAGTAAVAAGLSLRHPPSVDALTLLEVIGLLIVLSACAFVVLQFARRRADPRRGVAEIADLLAAAVLRQWATEARIRRLNDPYPLPVSWDAAPDQDASWERLRAAVSRWPASFRPEPDKWASRAEDLAGRGEDLAQRLLDQVPSRRILLLGDTGAGKSILMVRLTLSLLQSRRPGGPVPVLVPLSSWNPMEQELRSWLRDRLSIDYPTLVDSGSGGAHADSGFDALLDTHKMILLLDGLDEIQPAALRSAAVERINRELEPGHVFLVTCRTDDCPPAPPGESPILHTPSVVLNDLDAATVRGYLCADAGAAAAEERWEKVFQARADSAIAAVLRTPLMVSLIRAIYSPRSDPPSAVLPDPEELCDISRFPDQATIEDHLLDGLIPAMYGNERRTRERAERWLRFLARHLDRAGTSDLEWWELRRAVPRYLTGVICGLGTGSVAGAAAVLGGNHVGTGIGAGLSVGLLTVLILRRFTKLTGNLANAFAAGAAGGLLGALCAGLILNGVLRLNVPPTIGLIGGIEAGLALAPIGRTRGGAIGGFLGGIAVALCAGRGSGLPAGIIDGFAVAFTVGCTVEINGRRTPARGVRGMRWSPIGLLAGGGVAMAIGLTLAVGLKVGYLPSLITALATGLATGIVAGLESSPHDLTRIRDPWTSFVLDLTTFWTAGLSAALALGLMAGLGINPIVGLGAAFGYGLAVAFMQAAAGPFTLAWLWLVCTRQLPWRFFGFLADAHQRRSVFRQVGSAYQFRHLNLQHRLAHTGAEEMP